MWAFKKALVQSATTSKPRVAVHETSLPGGEEAKIRFSSQSAVAMALQTHFLSPSLY